MRHGKHQQKEVEICRCLVYCCSSPKLYRWKTPYEDLWKLYRDSAQCSCVRKASLAQLSRHFFGSAPGLSVPPRPWLLDQNGAIFGGWFGWSQLGHGQTACPKSCSGRCKNESRYREYFFGICILWKWQTEWNWGGLSIGLNNINSVISWISDLFSTDASISNCLNDSWFIQVLTPDQRKCITCTQSWSQDLKDAALPLLCSLLIMLQWQLSVSQHPPLQVAKWAAASRCRSDFFGKAQSWGGDWPSGSSAKIHECRMKGWRFGHFLRKFILIGAEIGVNFGHFFPSEAWKLKSEELPGRQRSGSTNSIRINARSRKGSL